MGVVIHGGAFMLLNSYKVRDIVAEEEQALAEAIYKEAMIDYIVLYSGHDYTRSYITHIQGAYIHRYWTKERLRDWLLNSVIAHALYKNPELILKSVEVQVSEHQLKGDIEKYLKEQLKRKSIVKRKEVYTT